MNQRSTGAYVAKATKRGGNHAHIPCFCTGCTKQKQEARMREFYSKMREHLTTKMRVPTVAR